MGILTLLRNAFGRSRKARSAEAGGAADAAETASTSPTSPAPTKPAPEPAAEPAAEAPAAPKVPSPSPEPTPAPRTASVPEPREEHDLVSAAFDNITVPKPTRSDDPPAPAQEAKATPEPDPAPEPKAEPEPEARQEPTPEPAAKAEPEAEVEEKPEAVTEPATADGEDAPQGPPAPDDESSTGGAGGNESPAEGEAEAAPEPKTEPTAEAEAKPEATTEAELKTEPKDEAKAEPEAVTEPAAADGEDAPQGPPAPDDESSTGGAGENESPAEGEAEAAPEPEAEPTAEAEAKPEATTEAELKTEPEPEAEAEAEGEAEQPTPKPAPATPPTKLRNTTLTTAYKAAGATLKKNDLTGTRAKIYLVLDRSASMRPYYKDGSAQALAEQTLALAAHVDTEATLHVTFFSTELDGTGELTLTDHENKIDELHAGLGRMGRTSYHAAVEAVLTKHAEEPAGTPALVVFQTDGAPDAKTPATQALTDAAKNHPAVFFSFVAFGEHDNKAFDYLRKLKTENTSFFHAGPTPRELTDKELYEGVLASWRP
ncbi:VWA domain-containing protein [Streptomyces sp. NPDC005009]